MFKLWKVDVYKKINKQIICVRELLLFYYPLLTIYHINNYAITLSLNIFFSTQKYAEMFSCESANGPTTLFWRRPSIKY